jgi:hypothetical protein
MFVAPDGNVIGIHYADWSPWNKTNDFSYNGSNSFLENPNIAVYVNGTKVYGNEQLIQLHRFSAQYIVKYGPEYPALQLILYQ